MSSGTATSSWLEDLSQGLRLLGVSGVVTRDSNLEREVKLDAGPRFELPDLSDLAPGVVVNRLPHAKLQAIYIDTADLRLMRWGVTLRHRRDLFGGNGGESGWTLKLPEGADGVAMVRNELFWPGPFGAVPAEATSLVRAHARTAPLEAVAKLSSVRQRVELRDGAGRKLGEIDDDVVSVLDGRRLAARFRQVEVETTDAIAPELLEELLRRLTAAGAVTGDDRPKAVRAIGPRASLAPDVVVPELGPEATVATVVQASIASGVTRIIGHDPGVRLGDDPEHVHQARVGTRRLRSDLGTFSRLLDPDWGMPVRSELAWLAAALGEVRDADVMTGRLRGQIRSLPDGDAKAAAGLLRKLAGQRDAARHRLLEVLDSDRYLILLDNLTRAAAEPPLAPPAPVAAQAPPTEEPEAATQLAGQPVAATACQCQAAPPLAFTNQEGAPRGAAAGPIPTLAVSAAPRRVAALLPPSPGGGDPKAEGPAALKGATGEAALSPTPLPIPVKRGEQRAADALVPLVRRPWKHLAKAVADLGDDPPDEALHRIRIRAKRLRYSAEAVAGVIGTPARRLAEAVAEVQGVLGDLQDAVVAESWLRRQASVGPPTQALVAGQLVTFERQKQASCRDSWRAPWKAASRRSLRSWLKR